MAEKILEGIRVVELGTHVAVPYCTRELGDMGAEVIKVEPLKGESYRGKMGMLFQLPNKPGADYVYTPYNVNKKSLCLNLKDEAARDAFLKVLEGADIFVSNTRERALEKLGIGFDFLREKFPKLIIGSVNGFGIAGPDKDRPGYDATAFWSASGPIQEWTVKGQHVFKPFYGFGDSIAAAQLTAGIIGALYKRTSTGQGDIVRVSLMGSGLWHNVCGLLRYQAGHTFPKDLYDPIVPLDNFYKTKDGKWFLTSEECWPERCEAYFKLFGVPELMDDPEWSTMRGYVSNIPEKAKFFQEHIAQVTSEEIEAALKPAGAVFSFLDETDDVLKSEQAWENGFLKKMHTLDGTELTIASMPIQYASQEVLDDFAPAPQLGQDTEAVLRQAGVSDADIAAMIESWSVISR